MTMGDGFLSQAEIDALLNSEHSKEKTDEGFSQEDKDVIGEIGNIAMGAAASALSTIIDREVSITTPQVEITDFASLKETFHVPNIALEIEYVEGLTGSSLLIMKIGDASVVAQLMMMEEEIVPKLELDEMAISAISEAMNQMIGAAATSMSQMLGRMINISAPAVTIWDQNTQSLQYLDQESPLVKVAFRMVIEGVMDSTIMQIFSMETAKEIRGILLGSLEDGGPTPEENGKVVAGKEKVQAEAETKQEEEQFTLPPPKLDSTQGKKEKDTNIEMILDIPLEVSVILGRTRRSISEVLSFNTGTLVELDKMVDEPVEILVNGKLVALGEVVVVEENFGVKVTDIISSVERAQKLRN